jgi:thiosulfate/3-mercaptopyruvate sulfurtransferase
MTAWTTLVDAETLATHLHDADLRIFDCRFALNDTAAGERAWQESHIPRARYAHLDRDLSGAHTLGAGRHPWPSAADFGDWLGRNGVTPDMQVVVYDAGDGAFAARLWWLLRVAGHARVAVLDGGFARWAALGLPTDDGVEPVVPGHYPVAFDDSRLLDADAVAARVSAGGLLLDARGAERFRGDVEPIDRVAGHVPGATGPIRRIWRTVVSSLRRASPGNSARCSPAAPRRTRSRCAAPASPPATTCSPWPMPACRARPCSPVRGAAGSRIPRAPSRPVPIDVSKECPTCMLKSGTTRPAVPRAIPWR